MHPSKIAQSLLQGVQIGGNRSVANRMRQFILETMCGNFNFNQNNYFGLFPGFQPIPYISEHSNGVSNSFNNDDFVANMCRVTVRMGGTQ
jgi:hypothetical protein